MIRKYLTVFFSLFRASAMADLEYRLNIVVKIFTDIIWYVAQLSVFEVLFRHTNQISGWTLDSTRVFMGVLFVVDAMWMLLFSENLDRMSDKVRKGELDLLLSKPVNSQFMISLQRMNTAYLANIAISSGWLFYALSRYPEGIQWERVLLLIVLIPCSLLITYSLRFLFSACALIFTRAEHISFLWYQLYRLGMRPDAVYPPWLRYVVLTIIPVGFLASVPSRMILQTPDITLVLASIGIAAVTLYGSTRFWRFALRFYSSASS